MSASTKTLFRSFVTSSFCHLSRYGRAHLVQIPLCARPFVIGPHWPGVVFTVALICGGAAMNRNAVRAAVEKHALSLTAGFLLSSFVQAMALVTVSLLLLTACSDPGIVFAESALRAMRSERRRQTRACCAGKHTTRRRRYEDEERERREDDTERERDRDSASDDDSDNTNNNNNEDSSDGWEDSTPLQRRERERENGNSQRGDILDESDCEAPSLSLSTQPRDDTLLWRQRGLPFCATCKVRTPLSRDIYHCQDCGFCVEGMDHHCVWMGQCIGKRNMPWFVLFNISWVLFLAEFLILVFFIV